MTFPKDEIVVEINHPRNSDVYFRPIQKELRSRFLTPRSGARPQAPLQAFSMTSIPGQRIHINMKQKYCKITDPLADAENKEILKLINKVAKQLNPPRPQMKPIDNEEFRSMVEVQLYSWLYYTILLIEGKKVNLPSAASDDGLIFDSQPFAEILSGEFPKGLHTSLLIRQSGKVMNYNPRPFRGESKFVHPVDKQDLEHLEAVAEG